MVELSYPWLSFTAISTYVSCPRRFQYKYVNFFDEMETPFMIRGRIVHEIFEEFFDELTITKVMASLKRHKMDQRIEKTITYNMFLNLLHALLDRKLMIPEDSEEWALINRMMMSFSRMQVQRLYVLRAQAGALTREIVRDHWFPMEKERFYMDHDNKIYGKIDAVWRNFDGTYDIVDYKTGSPGKKDRKPRPAETLQARLYTRMFCTEEEIDPARTRFHFVYTSVPASKLPRIITINYNKSAEKKILNKVQRIRDRIDAGIFNRVIDFHPLTDKPVNETRIPFFYKRVCGYCSYTYHCHGIEPDEFRSWMDNKIY